MRKFLIGVLILGVLGVAGWFGYSEFQKSRSSAEPEYQTVAVERGEISATVSATGIVLPEREANLAFQASGIIADVAVDSGASVSAGQELARLDTADLALAVRQAEISVRQAQAQLQEAQAGPNEVDLSAAQAALESAQAAYQQLLEGPDADQLAAARAAVDQAKVAMDQAQQVYDRIRDQPNAGMLPQSLQLQQATINYETALAQYRVAAQGASSSQLAAAQAQIVQAQASLDRLQRGATDAQLEVARLAVEQAQLAVEQAERRLQNASLAAPWDGVITAVNIMEGTPAQPGAPALRIADTSRFHLEVQVDEVDIAGITEGQEVGVEIDALPDLPFTGKVSRIAPAAVTGVTGGVSYQVRIDIAASDAALRAGMSATATIIASVRRDVLLIPNRAVQLERETGRTYVERLVAGQPQQVEVRLGLRDDQQSEVREGLEDGDQVVIRSRTSLDRIVEGFGGF